MKLFLLTLFVWALQAHSEARAQTKPYEDMYAIISVVIDHVNPKIPIADTLIPTVIESKFLREQLLEKIALNNVQKRSLKKLDANEKGILIDSNRLTGYKIKSFKAITNAIKQLSSRQVAYLLKEEPFYMLGKPIIFTEGIAVADMNLLSGFGAIYILKKKEGNWEIVNEVGKWYN